MEDRKRRRADDGHLQPPGEGESHSLKVMKQVVSLLNSEEALSILAEAAVSHPEVSRLVTEAVGKDKQNRKLFVRNLDLETTSDGLHAAFSSYGKIQENSVIKDKMSGRSRGFGFVTFSDMESTVKALQDPTKVIDGKKTVCQLAVLGGRGPQEDVLLRKIFVANVPNSITSERLLEFFSQFGVVDEGPIGLDKVTNRPKGYALFIYKTSEGATRALEEPYKLIDGHQVFCKMAGDPKGKNAAKSQGPEDGLLHGTQLVSQEVFHQQPGYQTQSYTTQSYVQPQSTAYSLTPQLPQQPTLQQQQVYAFPGQVNGTLSTAAGRPQLQYQQVPAQTVFVASASPQQAYVTQPGQASTAGGYIVATAVPAGPAGYTLLPAGSSTAGAGLVSVQQQQQHHHQQQQQRAASLLGATPGVYQTPGPPSGYSSQAGYRYNART